MGQRVPRRPSDPIEEPSLVERLLLVFWLGLGLGSVGWMAFLLLRELA